MLEKGAIKPQYNEFCMGGMVINEVRIRSKGEFRYYYGGLIGGQVLLLKTGNC